MPSVDLTPYYQPQSSTSDGTKFDNLIAAIQTALNALDNSNFVPGTPLAVNKLAPGTNGYVLTTTAGVPVWAASSASATTYRKTTAKTVNTTVAATDLLNGEITIAANPGANAMIRMVAFGDYKQNSGGTTNAPRWQLLLGATTLFDTGAPAFALANAATRYGWSIKVEIANAGAANSQVAYFALTSTLVPGAGTSSAFTTGEGLYVNNGLGNAYGSAAEDTTTSKALVLNIINPSASANYETVLKGALVEVI